HCAMVVEPRDRIESGQFRDLWPRSYVDNDRFCAVCLARNIELSLGDEACVSVSELHVWAGAPQPAENTSAPCFNDAIFSGHNGAKIHGHGSGMNTEPACRPRDVCSACACDHRLCRRAPEVDARAADELTLDNKDAFASSSQARGERYARLSRANDDDVE